eukprot:CAMPEP_0119483784 /NCGR_PEP_ID=MMETSP1344-20130328/11038_1 /TAXON_ID=236787 /ORGANISM="Florenciella parvula, Strain CCMP2471" /LENGTH=54 /DNA_ID=CAMNT_0007518301 /DNA_START=27 /DNA_END=188 /DNA_ORIENTATION=-
MTLTVVVGSSGSGKTTFLNDVHKVKKIPSFDPKQLPYWNIYEKEAKEDSILIGG